MVKLNASYYIGYQWVLLQAVSIELIFINIDSDVFTDYSSLVVVVQDVFLLAMSNSV